MPCYCEPPLGSFENALEGYIDQGIDLFSEKDAESFLNKSKGCKLIERACKLCSFLTKEQLLMIENNNKSGYIGILSWYSSHLLHDYSNNYKDKKERERIKKEGDRIGINLFKEGNGFCYTTYDTCYT